MYPRVRGTKVNCGGSARNTPSVFGVHLKNQVGIPVEIEAIRRRSALTGTSLYCSSSLYTGAEYVLSVYSSAYEAESGLVVADVIESVHVPRLLLTSVLTLEEVTL